MERRDLTDFSLEFNTGNETDLGSVKVLLHHFQQFRDFPGSRNLRFPRKQESADSWFL
jgi:hypothetical protein